MEFSVFSCRINAFPDGHFALVEDAWEAFLRLHPAFWRSVLGLHPSFCYLSLFEWSIDRESIVFVLLDKLQLMMSSS